MANLLRAQYETVFSDPLLSSDYIDKASCAEIKMSNFEFTENDIIRAIDEISSTSASGPDGLPAIFIKKLKNEISKPLYTIWRSALNSGSTPSDLLTAHIIPVHKGDHRGVPANYCPIALTST